MEFRERWPNNPVVPIEIDWPQNALVKISPRMMLTQFVASLLPYDVFNHLRARLYHALGVRMGRDVQILGALTLVTAGAWKDKVSYLEIGDEAALSTPCIITLVAPVHIGRRVRVGMDAMILTGTHAMGGPDQRCGSYQAGPVEIGDGCWIGARVTILPGVKIGSGCVVAAGSVVTRSIPPNTTVAGNPARVIANLDNHGAPRAAAVP